MNDNKRNDEAVSSVVGEMIMITLVIILVALFATSAFSLVPGGREPSVDVAMVNKSGDTTVIFWHKGGDWVEGKDLTVIVINEDGKRKEYRKGDPEGKNAFVLYGYNDTVGGCVFEKSGESEAFDLGGCLNVTLDPELKTGDIVRLVTPKTVIYSGEIPP
jgi:hypothetical protein